LDFSFHHGIFDSKPTHFLHFCVFLRMRLGHAFFINPSTRGLSFERLLTFRNCQEPKQRRIFSVYNFTLSPQARVHQRRGVLSAVFALRGPFKLFIFRFERPSILRPLKFGALFFRILVLFYNGWTFALWSAVFQGFLSLTALSKPCSASPSHACPSLPLAFCPSPYTLFVFLRPPLSLTNNTDIPPRSSTHVCIIRASPSEEFFPFVYVDPTFRPFLCEEIYSHLIFFLHLSCLFPPV